VSLSDSTTSNGDAEALAVPVLVQRVRKAYEQVADQLRTFIVEGELPAGRRLPTEVQLAKDFGVSRATVREALRVLTTERLIETSKGAGGSFVTVPSINHISEFLRANLNLLTAAHEVSLDEFLELREMLEIPAARMAARRRDPELLHRLEEATPDEKLQMPENEQFGFNKDFHSIVVEGSGNTLLYVAAQPIFTVLQTAMMRSDLGHEFHERVDADHRLILAEIRDGNADGAEREMRAHIDFLGPEYRRVWRYAQRQLG
jgi:GntR family transcriptional repressor for pyruvate dehydrogenase complex